MFMAPAAVFHSSPVASHTCAVSLDFYVPGRSPAPLLLHKNRWCLPASVLGKYCTFTKPVYNPIPSPLVIQKTCSSRFSAKTTAQKNRSACFVYVFYHLLLSVLHKTRKPNRPILFFYLLMIWVTANVVSTAVKKSAHRL